VLKEPAATVGGSPAEKQTHPSVQVLTCYHTPFTALPRSISFAAGRPWRERLCTFAIFSLLPTIFFWIYFSLSVWPHISPAYSGLRVAAPITSLWITFGPLLMQQGEFTLERLIQALNDDGPDAGWNFTDIQRTISTAGRVYYWVTVPLAIMAAGAILAAYPALSAAIPLNSYSRPGGTFDLLITGFTAGSGIWAACTAIAVVRAATHRAAITWHPFRSQTPHGLTQLYTFTWSAAVIFSAGSVFLPALIVLRQRLGAIPSTIVLVFTAVLFAGGLILFTIPALMLYKLAQRQQALAIDQLAPIIETGISGLEKADRQPTASLIRTHYTVTTALQLRAAIATQNPAPVFSTLARAGTTLALPLFLTLIQIASTIIK
jgi:hypothetical protein